MTRDEWFLFTVQELDERLELRRREYDALATAWLLRKLFLNGERSLLSLVLSERATLAPDFTVVDHEPPENLMGTWPLWPWDGAPTKTLPTREFLRTPAAGFETRGGDHKMAIVSDMIAYVANVEGAVHLSRPTDARDQALWDLCWGETRLTPNGQFGGGAYCLIDIARVARAGLEPLRAQIVAEVWPTWLPEEARGTRRARDPRDFGWPSRTE